MQIQAPRKRFDNDGVDALALASGTIPHGAVDLLGNGTDRVLHAHDAGSILRSCRQRNCHSRTAWRTTRNTTGPVRRAAAYRTGRFGIPDPVIHLLSEASHEVVDGGVRAARSPHAHQRKVLRSSALPGRDVGSSAGPEDAAAGRAGSGTVFPSPADELYSPHESRRRRRERTRDRRGPRTRPCPQRSQDPGPRLRAEPGGHGRGHGRGARARRRARNRRRNRVRGRGRRDRR